MSSTNSSKYNVELVGDEDMKTLYVTSAATGLDGEYDGCLFKFRTDVKGVAPDYCVI